MGKKYVIEVEDEPIIDGYRVKYWRATKFPTIFFSAEELNDLEEYKEPVGHKFEVGDVCYVINGDPDSLFIITKVTSDYVHYMWEDGSHSIIRKTFFEHQAKFVRHSNYFEMFLQGGLK